MRCTDGRAEEATAVTLTVLRPGGPWPFISRLPVWRAREVMAMSDLLTVDEVARRARVHPETVKRAVRAGRLRAARLGARGAYRIREEWFDEWVDDQSIASSSATDCGPRDALAPKMRTRGRLAVGKSVGKLA